MENATTHSSSVEQTPIEKTEKDQDFGKLQFMEKKVSNIPLPLESERIVGKRKYLTWGIDNLYPQWLNYLYLNNAIHGGIINGKVHFTVSGGLKYTPVDQEDQLRFEKFFNNGTSEYDLNEIAEQLSIDLEISNKCMLWGRWSLDFSHVERLEIIDFEKGRKICQSTDMVVSDDWSDKKCGIKTYKYLDLKLKGSKAVKGQVRCREFYIEYQHRSKQAKQRNSKQLTKSIYPCPTYNGGIRSICTGIASDEYQNAEIENGFVLGTIINLNNGEPRNKDDKKDLETNLKNAATGVENTGGIWISYNNGVERAATVVNLTGNDLNNRYIEVNKDVQKNIIRAHSCTVPILFGVKEEGSLGNATELKTGYAIMNKNYFENRRKIILSLLNYVGQKCNGLLADIEFNEVNLDLPEDKPATPSVMINNGKFTEENVDEEKEARLMRHFDSCGLSRGGLNIIFSNQVKDTTKVNDQDCIDEFKKQVFVELTANQQQLLNLIGEGNSFDSIKKAMDMNASSLAKLYQQMISDDFINADGGLTPKGARQVANSDISKMVILYSYELRSDAPALVSGGSSRAFCEKLISLDRLYTREEIDKISNVEGYDVFSFKGGWYHDPKKDINRPSCRHTWVQNVVFE